jgi:ethanolaminephosphotransferase
MSRAYQYHCEERSILHPVLRRWLWGPALNLIPRGRSANSITLLGNVCSVIAFVFLALVPVTGVPDVAFFLPAIALFLYLSLDNIDGAHARRTDTSSPLGEFLDHWADAFNLGFIVLGYGLAMDLEPWLLLMALGLCALAYFATMWEQRVTGWLRFGPLGSIEGILLVSLMYVSVAVFGRDAIVATPVLGPMTVSHCFFTIVCAGFAQTALAAILRVRRPLLDFVPMVAALTLGSVWYAFGDLDVVPAAFLLVLSSCLFGGRQIIARVLDVPYRVREWVVLGGAAVGTLGGTALDWSAVGQEVAAWLLVAFVALRLAGDFVTTTSRLSDYLRRDELLAVAFPRPR